tara:strand:+ start:3528 stop:4193 length:666 start_codon:yes stop_codon:yes gene_type:complete
MGFEAPDIELFLKMRKLLKQTPNDSCAILGDCHFYYGDNLEQFKNRCGFSTVETFDINGNPTHKLNLQEPIPKDFHGKYDWVVDAGTLYCCFDVSAVLKNMMLMLSDSGTVFHTSNLVGHFGRGFYAFSPSFFNEFYEANGFQNRTCFYRTKTSGGPWRIIPTDHNYLTSASGDSLEFQDSSCVYKDMIPCESLIGYAARRSHRKEFTRPIPEHYCRSNGK